MYSMRQGAELHSGLFQPGREKASHFIRFLPKPRHWPAAGLRPIGHPAQPEAHADCVPGVADANIHEVL
jgi:hypothetical protein